MQSSVSGSAPPLAKKKASLIKKETQEAI